MNKLSQAIEQAIQQCKDFGSGTIELTDNEKTVIWAEWENSEQDNSYDVISICITQNGYTKFNYQLEETKILADM